MMVLDKRWASLALGVGLCLIATAAGAAGTGSAARVREIASPLLFEPNQGQTEEGVEYLARGEGYRLYLRGHEAVLSLAGGAGGHSVRLRLVGAASRPALGLDRRPSVSHYLLGADPSLWRRNVPHYGQVEYRDVYPGVSLLYYGHEGALEYDFVLAPGADPEAIRFEVEGATVRLDDEGNLVLTTPAGDLLQRAPVLYQDSPEGRVPVQGRFVMHGSDQVGFQVAGYDRSKALVIDPVLRWSRFLGGKTNDLADGVAVDVNGGIYVTGQTDSDDFPRTTGVVQPSLAGGKDAYVTKFKEDGSIVWSTYLGGSRGDDFGTAIAVDKDGFAYVTGWTQADDFPPKNPFQPTFRGPRDAFVSKLERDGSNLVYSTYLGGNGSDEANGIAVDPTQSNGEAVVVGVTSADNLFPLAFPLINTRNGPNDAFVTRFKADGQSLIFSTFWGGRGSETAYAVTLFGNEPVVVGGTDSDNFPLLNSQQPLLAGQSDAFVSMLKPDGQGVIFSTYLGGTKDETAFAVAADPTGFFIGGQTASTDFPFQNALQPVLLGPDDGFITKLNRSDFKIEYSTFLGGKQTDKVMGLAVDTKGYVYAAGSTTSNDFPLVDPIFSTYRRNSDVFVAKLVPTGCTLTYSTYLGGDGVDFGNALALGGDGLVYVVGQAGSGFPTTMPPGFQGPTDGFVVRIDDAPEANIEISVTDTPDPVLQGNILTYAIDVKNLGPKRGFRRGVQGHPVEPGHLLRRDPRLLRPFRGGGHVSHRLPGLGAGRKYHHPGHGQPGSDSHQQGRGHHGRERPGVAQHRPHNHHRQSVDRRPEGGQDGARNRPCGGDDHLPADGDEQRTGHDDSNRARSAACGDDVPLRDSFASLPPPPSRKPADLQRAPPAARQRCHHDRGEGRHRGHHRQHGLSEPAPASTRTRRTTRTRPRRSWERQTDRCSSSPRPRPTIGSSWSGRTPRPRRTSRRRSSTGSWRARLSVRSPPGPPTGAPCCS